MQAVEHDPDYLMAHFNLAETLLQATQHEAAYRQYEQVIGLDPKLPIELQAFDTSLIRMAGLDMRNGMPDRAVGWLEVLVESEPDHPSAHFMLGQALMALNREEEARREMSLHEDLAAAAGGGGTN